MKVALLIAGGISKINGKFDIHDVNKKTYINYIACAMSIKKHIIKANLECKFDIFIHSWAHDIRAELNDLYNPIKYSYEDNLLYKDELLKKTKNGKYSVISHSLSISKGIELIESVGIDYDFVIILRGDVLFFKDLEKICNLDRSVVYDGGHFIDDFKFKGDFIWIMSLNNAKIFKNMYNFDIIPEVHNFEYRFITEIMQKKPYINFKLLNIVAGKDMDVIRVVYTNSILCHKTLKIDVLHEYNLLLDELKSYSGEGHIYTIQYNSKN